LKIIIIVPCFIDSTYPTTAIKIAKAIGAAIGKMHDAEVVHGDLTTSNIMISQNKDCDSSEMNQIVFIDFGLGNMKPIVEDKAVDLYVLERAFVSTHPDSEYLVKLML
jgi:TP53 regulating kinase and related kinases